MGEEKRYTPSISLKESERDWIKKQARKVEISYTNYMRKVVLGELPPSDVPYRKKDRRLQFKNGVSQRDMEKILEHDLPKLGNNLNQLTRHVNETQKVGIKVVEEIKDIRRKMGEIGDTILKALRQNYDR